MALTYNIIKTLPNRSRNPYFKLQLKFRPKKGLISQSSSINDLGGKSPIPGLYESNSIILIQNGNLMLDAKGDPNAVWIFKSNKRIMTIGGAGGNVILKGGAQPQNVFWESRRMIHIGTGTSFIGNLKSIQPNTWVSFLRAKASSIIKLGQELLLTRNSAQA